LLFDEGGDRGMVIDYREAWRAAAALQVLADAGIAAVYTPDKQVSVSEDPTATQWLVHRVEVPEMNAARAQAVLEAHGLQPLSDETLGG
jgi:hypothetical protein